MDQHTADVSAAIEIALAPEAAFEALVDELTTALLEQGMTLEPGPHGRIVADGREVGAAVAWEPGRLVCYRWTASDWEPSQVTQVELRLEPIEGGTRATLSHRDWGALLGGPREIAGWFAGKIAAPLLAATAPAGLGNWITDRRARRPSGAGARGTYREPVYHYPNFRVILAELALGPDDRLLEVGCGGGAMLHEALKSGCAAAGIDHSADMLRVAGEVNADAIAAGRLELRQGDAHQLPFADETFTCGAMTGVLGFLNRPVTAMQELRRVLRPGGRLIVMGAPPELRGTPAAPEPIASRLHFYEHEQLRRLAVDAGFENAQVVRRELLAHAREAGVPEEHLALFTKPAPFLLAQK